MVETAPFTISRDLKAPRALVWQVQTEAQHIANWWSPEGFRTIHSDMDFRVGGTYHYGNEGPGGVQFWGLQTFREIVPQERIVLIQSFSDKDGKLTRHPMSAEWPLEMLSTTTFEDIVGGMTRLTISWRPYQSDEAGAKTFEAGRASMTGGFSGTLAKLEAYLAQLQK